MNLEQFLNRFTHNVESVIQWLFLLILALSGFLISRWLLVKKPEEAGALAGAGSPELTVALQQILERTAKLEAVAVQPMTAETAALAETQVQSLKKELASREDELKALKASGGGAGAAGDADQLNARLKELEAKLAEYEILEDDIADLSLYKEENVRLRSELDKLRNGGAAPAASSEPTPAEVLASEATNASGASVAAAEVDAAIAAAGIEVAATPPAPAAAEPAAEATPDIVAEFAQAVNSDAEVAAPETTMTVPDTGNPMQDFEAAVQIERKMQGAAPSQASVPAEPAAPVAAAPAAETPPLAEGAPPKPAPVPEGESADLFAEFAESPDLSVNVEATGLDTDKMMAEMAALVSLEPAAESSLEEGIDTDKMAAEAGALGGQKQG